MWLIAGLTAGCLAIAVISYFMTWHVFRDSGAIGAIGCGFIPDCDPSVAAGVGAAEGDSGVSHAGPLPVFALLACAISVLAVVVRRGSWFALGVSIGVLMVEAMVLLGVLFMASFVNHLFDHTEHQSAESWFYFSLLFALAGSVTLLVVTLPRRGRSGTDGSTEHLPPFRPDAATPHATTQADATNTEAS
jgi:hypothetical protein